MNITNIINFPKLSILTVIFTSIILTGCNSDNNSTELNKAVKLEDQRNQGTIIESVTIIGGQTRLRKGETHQLLATGIDSNNDVREITNEITWSSSDTTIATVNNVGLVTAVSSSPVNQGIVTIIGTTINDISGEGYISVSDASVSQISLKQTFPEAGNINTCISANVKGDVTYDDGYISLNTTKDMIFSLDNNTSATISNNGTFYTSAPEIEHTTITANIANISGMLTVTADPINLEKLSIFISDEATSLITLNIGERIQVNGKGSIANNPTIFDINETITWSQENASYAGVTTKNINKGTIFALKPGVTQLIGSCGGKQTIATLEVKGEADLESIQINDDSGTFTLAPFQSIELTLTANYTTPPSSLNVSEFAHWSINGSNQLNAELVNSGTNKAHYKLTSTSNSTSVAIVSASYDGITSSAHINIE